MRQHLVEGGPDGGEVGRCRSGSTSPSRRPRGRPRPGRGRPRSSPTPGCTCSPASSGTSPDSSRGVVARHEPEPACLAQVLEYRRGHASGLRRSKPPTRLSRSADSAVRSPDSTGMVCGPRRRAAGSSRPDATSGPRRYHSTSTRPVDSTRIDHGRPAREARSRGRRRARTTPRCAAPATPPCRAPGPASRPGRASRTSAARASGSSEAARWIREYHASTAVQPELVAGRPQPSQVPDLVASGSVEAEPRLRDHLRGQVYSRWPPRRRRRGRRSRAGSGAHLHHRSSGRVCDHPVQQPRLERLVRRARRRTARRTSAATRRRPSHPLVPGPGALGEHASRSAAGGVVLSAGGRPRAGGPSAGPCWPRRSSCSAPAGSCALAVVAQAQSRPGPGHRTGAVAPCGSSVRLATGDRAATGR